MCPTIERILRAASKFISSHWLTQNDPVCTITHDSESLSLITTDAGARQVDAAWSDILSVNAFQVDCFIIDQIRLLVQLSDNKHIELTGDMNGWDNLLKALPEYLQGCQSESECWPLAAFPPFKPNVTLLYQRDRQRASEQIGSV